MEDRTTGPRARLLEPQAWCGALLEASSDGVCLLEVLVTDDHPVNVRFLDLNPSFARQSNAASAP